MLGSKLVFKLAFFACAVVLATVVRVVHRRRAARVLAALDEGKRCIRCDGVDMIVEGERARCQTCGYSASLTWLKQSEVKQSDIDATVPSPVRLDP